MAQKDNRDEREKQKRHPILDSLEYDIAHAYAILDNLKLCIMANENNRTSACVRCRNELQKAYRQIDVLNAENISLKQKVRELKLQNEELMRFRTPDAYMDAVATALAMLPISSARKIYETTIFQEKTIKKASDILGIVATKEERNEARQRLKDCGLEDIDKRGGQNRKAVEMLVNGEVVVTFDSLAKAEKAIGTYNILRRIQSGKTINGVLFRFKETNK